MTYRPIPFPKMLYRSGEHLIVADEIAMAAALREGWSTDRKRGGPDAADNGKPAASKPRGRTRGPKT